MTLVTFSKPVAFPIAAVRMMLSQHLPHYRWQVGEDDNGAEKQMGAFHPLVLVSGRAASDCVFVELRAVTEPLGEPAPPHAWHVVIGAPTTEIHAVAERARLSILAALMFMDEAHAACRLRPGGNWLRIGELYEVFKQVHRGEDISVADRFGTPAERFDGGAPPLPAPAAADAPPPAPTAQWGPDIARRMLSPLVLMLDRTLTPDWRQVEEFARKVDPDGGWTHASSGLDVLAGRGTRIVIDEKPEPVPDYVYGEAFARSFWYSGDRAAVSRHGRHVTVGSVLDTSAADWETTRQTAKVVTLVTGLLARLPGTAAVLNLTVGTIFEPEMAGNFLAILGRDQLPIPLWTFTAPHSLEDGDVSLSTSGLVPFLGHELEVWNAPLSKAAVQEKLSNLMIYLLDRGPVIGHGDTAGQVEGERAIRCFLGPSRAQRAEPVQALLLEFEAATVTRPRPDLPERTAPGTTNVEQAGCQASETIDEALRSAIERSASPGLRRILGDLRAERSAGPPSPPPPSTSDAPPPQPGFGRRAVGFGRKGL